MEGASSVSLGLAFRKTKTRHWSSDGRSLDLVGERRENGREVGRGVKPTFLLEPLKKALPKRVCGRSCSIIG